MSETKYNIWKCYTCSASCIIPFDEPYEDPHICAFDNRISADFRHEEIGECDLLTRFLKVGDV